MKFDLTNPFEINVDLFNNKNLQLPSNEMLDVLRKYNYRMLYNLGNGEYVGIQIMVDWENQLRQIDQTILNEFDGNIDALNNLAEVVKIIREDEMVHLDIVKSIGGALDVSLASLAELDEVVDYKINERVGWPQIDILAHTTLKEINASILAGFPYLHSDNTEKKDFILRQFRDEVQHTKMYTDVIINDLFPYASKESKDLILDLYLTEPALPWPGEGTILRKYVFDSVLDKENWLSFFDCEYFDYALAMHVKYRHPIISLVSDISVDEYTDHLKHITTKHLEEVFNAGLA